MATRNSTNNSRIFGQGLTFDDVLLMPAFSEILPSDVNIHAQLTKNIKLHVPILSSAMDTVTEASLAIALAREGGIGILHKNMSIERQAEQVRKVKRSESGMIVDPITLEVNATIGDALNLMKENKIGGIPIVDKGNKLVGILTNRDLRFEHDKNRPIVEVMTSDNLVTAAVGTSLKDAEAILQKHKIEKLLIVNDNNKLVGLITFRDITKVTLKPIANKDQFGRLRVAAAIGVTSDAVERASALVNSGVDAVIIDTAHGHTKGVVDVLKQIIDGQFSNASNSDLNEDAANTRNFTKWDIEHSGVPVGQPSPKAVVGQEFIEHLSDTMTRTSRSGSGYGDKYKVVADNGDGTFACEKIS